MPPRYLLDADVFINSHQCQYGMDFCPAFWDWLATKNREGRVFSIDRICSELEKFDDKLCEWAKRMAMVSFSHSTSTRPTTCRG